MAGEHNNCNCIESAIRPTTRHQVVGSISKFKDTKIEKRLAAEALLNRNETADLIEPVIDIK
jgi:hypothetical protein